MLCRIINYINVFFFSMLLVFPDVLYAFNWFIAHLYKLDTVDGKNNLEHFQMLKKFPKE